MKRINVMKNLFHAHIISLSKVLRVYSFSYLTRTHPGVIWLNCQSLKLILRKKSQR